MNKIKEVKSPLVEYNEITVEIDHDKNKTPTNQEVLAELSKGLKVENEHIKIKQITTTFGSSKSKIVARVYKDVNVLKRIEEVKKKPKVKKEKKKAPPK